MTFNLSKTNLLLVAIIGFSLFWRLFQLSYPTTYYFDEVYHAFTAKAYANNDPRGYEWWNTSPEEGTAYEWLHPPVSKLIMGASINLFGANPFAWRLPGAILGAFTIYLVYALCLELTKKKRISLLAAALASFDGLLLVQSRIAMNDIYLITFMLLSLLFYAKWKSSGANKHFILASLFFGISISNKWSGVFILGIIGGLELIQLIKMGWKKWSQIIPKLFLGFGLIPILIYLFSFTQFFLQGHSIEQFAELHNQIFRYQFGLEATHPYQSKAWEWPLLLKPVWYFVDYSVPERTSNIYALSNPLLAWAGLIAVITFIIRTLKKRSTTLASTLPIFGYLVIWLPWMFSPRIMFFYHYAPAIPFLSIILASEIFELRSTKAGRITTSVLIALIVFSFFLFLPIWVGIPIHHNYSQVIFWLPSWK